MTTTIATDGQLPLNNASDVAVTTSSGLRPLVVVTGGSRGLGLALALTFAKHGSDVALVARDERDLHASAQTIRNTSGRHAVAIKCDLTDRNASDVIRSAVHEHGFYVDVVVNNAGVGLAGPLIQSSVADLENLIALNVRSTTVLTREFLPQMIARRRGGILNIASLGAYVPGPHQAAYYASKAYVMSMTEAVAAECSGTGVRIAVAVPGPLDTQFHEAMGAERSLYRKIVPSMTADRAARSIHRQFRFGIRLIAPGLTAPVMALALRLVPHPISVPLVSWLLKIPSR